MKPFLILFGTLLMLIAACKKSTSSNSPLTGNWKMVAYTDTRTNKIIFTPADSISTLSLDGSRFVYKAKDILQNSGTYHTSAPTRDQPYYTLIFDGGTSNEVEFHNDTMVILTVIPLPLGSPNNCRYIKN